MRRRAAARLLAAGPLVHARAVLPAVARRSCFALCLAGTLHWPAGAKAAAPEEPRGEETGDADAPPAVVEPARQPPRIDGAYLGVTLFPSVVAVRLNELDTPGPFAGAGGTIRFGQMVLPWLGLGLRVGGLGGVRSEEGARQVLGMGGLLVDFDFVPAPKRLPLTLVASFGFGGGAATQEGVENRSGFGGALFGATIRYEWFPGAHHYRPTTGGGFGLGPELGYLGATPAARGRPMAHAAYLGLSMTWYFGS